MAQIATIPAHQPFVDALAAGLLAEAGADRLALADMFVLLPTRRACRTLREAFLRQAGADALLLPRIQPIGEVEPEELILDGTLEVNLPPAIAPMRRQILLARLLAPVEPHLEHGLRLAGELSELLDELQAERVPLDRVHAIIPEELAEHWQHTRRILEILAQHWPRILAEEGVMEAAERRHLSLAALARRWREQQTLRRIVAAGSTGSIPATRLLLQAIASLPRGIVVLPGLDRAMDPASWEALTPSHPQYGLKRLLAELGYRREEVATWHAPGVRDGAPQRALLLREVMRPAATVGAWRHLEQAGEDILAGLTVEEHPDLASEALAIALRMRYAVEDPTRTAALVTPDRHLARRVAVELRRWGIQIDDSAGTPLDQTPPGAFLLLAAHLVVEGIRPVALLSLLKHPLARLGREQRQLRRQVRALELACLRGPRLVGGFPALLAELRRQQRSKPEHKELPELIALVEELERAARDFVHVAEAVEARVADLVRAHVSFAETLARDATGRTAGLWGREAGEVAAVFIAELVSAAGVEHRIPTGAYPAFLALLMASRAVRPRAPRHSRLHILGQLEARLQHADLVLLGGLNEGVWPALVEQGPWLNQKMRDALGLPPAERRVGLAAHDLTQLASAREVVLSRAEKDAQGNPTVPSRWLIRLQTVLAALAPGEETPLAPDSCWAGWRSALDALRDEPRPCPQPEPRPPLAVRPRSLSVSDIGIWMRDPYALYARRILRLVPLDPLEADTGPLERGNIIHRALEQFVQAFPRDLPDDAQARLCALGRRFFEAYAHRPQVQALWWPRFVQAAQWFIQEECRRRSDLKEILVEVEGELEIAMPAGPFRLRARADRIERRADGRLVVIDYKTGALPDRREVMSGRLPQLPLEAAMLATGAFGSIGPAEVAGLFFWSLKGDEYGGGSYQVPGEPAAVAAQALQGLRTLIAHYDAAETAYRAILRPRAAARQDYDHLARMREWST